jgi:hypothetical protein
MTRRTLILLAATALAGLLAGCGVIQQDNGSSSSQDSSSPQQQFEAANTNSAGACTGSAGADLQQEGRGEVSNGKIAFSRTNADLTSRVYVIDEDGTNETGLTDNLPSASGPVWSPDGEQIAFAGRRDSPFDIYVMDADGTEWKRIALKVASEEGPVSVSWGRG